MMRSHFDRQEKTLDELTEEMRATNQRLAGLQHEDRQPRLTTEEDVEPDIKARKSTENAAADRVKNGDSCFARRVDDGSTSLTSFGMIAEPPALQIFRDDTLVDKSAEELKQCLSPVEMRTPTVTGGLLSARTASTAIRAIFPRPLFFRASVKRPRREPAGQASTSLPLLLGEGLENEIKENSGV